MNQPGKDGMTDYSQMTLGQKQELFSRSLALLLQFAFVKGYEVRMGAVLRKGEGERLHALKLAADLNLFRDGEYLTETEDHRELGVFWESLGPLHFWGGRFNDGNHYSIRHGGMR